ncbi:hypothetical protein [Nostoc sp. 'Peltigera membranacea cyanobiont' 232]|uniref:hypothetical protein n=1 Tax=Nostoc sp. 'Peltigera membranacea cyanobiont' 232 TaxID=2014531 RepID=UPI000B95A715|nr:hypothetical protein [Nostoc sp. 'Peltigera membranacea cyanobiont' 232]OYE04639.1 hypothetical protein CDG79_12135 [Nostoc sp. 'Peltigera membranacea cyanobiont' 232]
MFQQPLPSLLPFVPILRGGGEVSVVQRALQALRADAQLNELESLLAFFANFVLDTPLVQQIMRRDMTVLRESPWYQEILREGETRGKASGELRGILSGIEINLELKFGDRGLQLMPEINHIQDLERLKTILRNIVTANTIEELQQIL